MSVNFPSYLMKKSYSYYARIRVPKDIKLHFRSRTELRFSLKTNNITAAKSKARLVVGLVQWVFRNIRNGGQLAVLSDEQINKLIKDHINRLLDEDLESRLEYPQWVPKGDRIRNEMHGEMLTRRGKTLEKLLDYDFSEASEEMEMVLKEAGHDIPKDKVIFNKMCQVLLKGHVHYYEVLAERALGKHLFDGRDNQIVGVGSETAPQAQPSAQKSQPDLITMGKLAEAYWKERAENWGKKLY